MVRAKGELLFGAALILAGCAGTVDGSGSGAPAGGTSGDQGGGGMGSPGGHPGGGGGGSGPPGQLADVPGPAPLRRLTNLEYRNTVRDLLGIAPAATDFNKDLESFQSGFGRGAAITKGTDARMFMDASDSVLASAAAMLPGLLPCKSAPAAPADQDHCVQQFIQDFGLRAYRRPVTSDEAGDLLALYTSQKMLGASFNDAVQALLLGILQ